MKHFEIHLSQPGILERYTREQLEQGCDGEVIPHPRSAQNPRAGLVCRKCGVRIGLKDTNPALHAFRADWARRFRT